MTSREFSRTDRVADAVKRALATLIQQEVRDPRVGMVNVNDVELSRDLAIAKVYISFVGKDEDADCREACDALNHAAAYLRTLLAKQLAIRTTPKLQFFYDKTAIQGQQLSHLIDRAVASDQSRHDD
ncbi:MAG: 30S ribosome-binding factor RbfA [Cellvibrionaceae bacterium]|nr:30S ribosome-binding factor RbfA [Cellvibrionaceae bacterium]